jgi:hypothetical protein
MKPTLPSLFFLLACAAFGPPRIALAQTPTLEFATGTANPTLNPTGNGPTVANQVITFQGNLNNPNDNVFTTYTPTTTATFSLSNQVFSQPTNQLSTGTGMAFGARANGGGAAATSSVLFDNVNAIGGSTNANYTYANGVSGGIEVTINKAVEIFTSVQPLPATVPANARYQFADLTVTFSQPIINPVIHVTGLGGTFNTVGFTAELDLLSSGVTLSKISGSSELNVTSSQILNSTDNPSATTGSGGASGSVLVTTPNTGITSVVFRVYLRPSTAGGVIHPTNGTQHIGESWMISVSSLAAIPPITGYVYEDVNYGGGAGRPRSATGTVVRPNARVELYNSAGTFVSATTTDANGLYSFTPGVGNYTVRVVNSSVTSSRTGTVTGLLPVQTYNGTTTQVGGQAPEKVDAGNGTTGTTLASLNTATTIAESQAAVTVAVGATATGADFGYNFDTVVNTNNTGQGSLRQFITNANALGGENTLAQSGSNVAGALPTGTETSIFMIPSGLAVAGQQAGLTSGLTNGVAAIALTSALPTITGPNTSIDGTTQTFNVGNTNDIALGTGGTVGTNNTALGQLNGPEVQVRGTNTFNGFTLNANNTTVRGLSIYGFDTGILGGVNNTGTRIERNVIGASAISFTDPTGTNRTLNEGINLNDSDGGTVTNNLIGFNGGMGIWVLANGNGSNNNTITGNEIRSNALIRNVGNGERLVFDGLELQGNSTGNTVSGNLITANVGHGIDTYGNGIGGNTITGNTISNNGVGVANNTGEEGSGLRVFGATNPTIISNNVLTGNNGSGVLVEGTASQVTISRNVTSGNTRLGIDLLTTGETNLNSTAAGTPFWNGNTGTTSNVTVNDNGDTATGGNGLLNFPVLTTANVSGTSVVINGYARPGSLVEFFLATPLTTDPTNSNRNFGQGSSFLASRTEGLTADDSNAETGTYGANNATVNGVYQGTDNTNLFRFSIPLANLTTDQRTALLSGNAILTSTATLNRNTSEFSGNLALTITDVTVALTGPTTLNAGQPTGTYTATFTNEGPVTAVNVARTVTLPTGASLSTAQQNDLITRYRLTTDSFVTTGSGATAVTTINFGSVASVIANASSAVTFAFTAPAAASTTLGLIANTSTDTSEGVNTAPNQATLNLNTVTTADVTAAIVASATATTGKFSVTFGNNGPQTAAGVAYTVQLPAGLNVGSNVVAASNGGSYDNTSGLVSYPTAATTITSTGTFASDITYLLNNATGAAVTATARVSTTTNENGITANNVASATMAPQFDLTTTLTGPTTAAVTGSPTMLYVTTTNNGPNTAGTATQTVTIPSGATLAGSIYITNGGVYAYANGIGTVTFPALTNVPSGQTVTNSISFLAPSAAFAPTAAVTTTSTTETNTANNTANLNGGANGTAVAVTSNAVQANEATTITATVGNTTTPATVVSPGTVVTYTVTSTNKGFTGTTPSATVIERVQLLPGLNITTLRIGGVTGTVQANGTIQYTTPAVAGNAASTTTAGTSTYDPITGVLTYYTVTGQASGFSELYPTITVTTPAAVGNGGQLVATASVSTDLQDNVPADNVASVGVRVRTAPDVATTITGPSTTTAGLPATYVVKFTNSGATDASSVTQIARLPAGLSNVVVTDANGTTVSGIYNSTTGQITFPSITNDVTGTTQFYNITLTAPAQTFPVSSTITTVTSDGITNNNSANLTTTVTPNADLAVSITGPATAVVGNLVTYAVTATNNGPTTASNVAATVQLPMGLTDVTAGPGTTAGSYNSTTGLLTFATTTLTAGNSAVNYVSFTMPSATSTTDPVATGGQLNLTAGFTAASLTNDQVASNNTAGLTTSVAPATTATADLVTTLVLTTPANTPASVAAGTSLTYTATYRNNGSGNGTGSVATNVVSTVNLPAGLSASTLLVGNNTGSLSGNVITFTSGPAANATYNTVTGLLTFPTVASLAASTTATSYTINFPAPVGNGQLVVASAISSQTSDNGPLPNVATTTTTITPVYDVTTTLVGPLTAQAGVTNIYTVTTLNNGPSTATAATTQNVTGLPSGLTVATLLVDGLTGTGTGTITFTNSAGATVATYSGTTLTFPSIANLPAGAANAAVHTFSLPMPVPTSANPSPSIDLIANVSSANETNVLANTDARSTVQANIAPVAQNVWNTLQSARSNDANTAAPTGLPISPLSAMDIDVNGSIGSYTVVTIPTTTQGVLYYNGSAITAGNASTTLITDATKLTFAPTPGYVGNATFTYLATDNGNGVTANTLSSPVAIYTIAVAADQEAPAYTLTPKKGAGIGAYVPNDVIAYTVDPNTANYGTTGTVYSLDGKTLNTNANNGITTATTTGILTKGATTGIATLNDLGLVVDANGRLVVNDPGTLANPKLRSGSYSVSITTIDTNGGVTTQTVNFDIPANPLPVVLTALTAQAVQNRDALLTWTTASEVNSAYFEVERSLDGKNFTKIGQQAAKGNSAISSNYTFTDANVIARANGAVYYRLRQVDLDATANYSPVRTVSFTKVAAVALSLYPNPAQNATTLDVSALPATGTYQVLVLDATGRAVRTVSVGGGQLQTLNLTNLASGTYQVLVTGTLANGDALRQVIRLTKE